METKAFLKQVLFCSFPFASFFSFLFISNLLEGGLLSIPLLFSSVLLSNDYPPIPPHDAPYALSQSRSPPPLFSLQLAEKIECQIVQRPIIYMNTCNHLMHLRNTNSSPPSSPSSSHLPLSFHTYADHEIEFTVGNREEAQKYGREQVENRAKPWACWLMWALRIRF